VKSRTTAPQSQKAKKGCDRCTRMPGGKTARGETGRPMGGAAKKKKEKRARPKGNSNSRDGSQQPMEKPGGRGKEGRRHQKDRRILRARRRRGRKVRRTSGGWDHRKEFRPKPIKTDGALQGKSSSPPEVAVQASRAENKKNPKLYGGGKKYIYIRRPPGNQPTARRGGDPRLGEADGGKAGCQGINIHNHGWEFGRNSHERKRKPFFTASEKRLPFTRYREKILENRGLFPALKTT